MDILRSRCASMVGSTMPQQRLAAWLEEAWSPNRAAEARRKRGAQPSVCMLIGPTASGKTMTLNMFASGLVEGRVLRITEDMLVERDARVLSGRTVLDLVKTRETGRRVQDFSRPDESGGPAHRIRGRPWDLAVIDDCDDLSLRGQFYTDLVRSLGPVPLLCAMTQLDAVDTSAAFQDALVIHLCRPTPRQVLPFLVRSYGDRFSESSLASVAEACRGDMRLCANELALAGGDSGAQQPHGARLVDVRPGITEVIGSIFAQKPRRSISDLCAMASSSSDEVLLLVASNYTKCWCANTKSHQAQPPKQRASWMRDAAVCADLVSEADCLTMGLPDADCFMSTVEQRVLVGAVCVGRAAGAPLSARTTSWTPQNFAGRVSWWTEGADWTHGLKPEAQTRDEQPAFKIRRVAHDLRDNGYRAASANPARDKRAIAPNVTNRHK